MTVTELKRWLEKSEREGAVDLKLEMNCFYGQVKLISINESNMPIEAIMLNALPSEQCLVED